MLSTVSIATLFLINAYNFYSITAEGEANIGNIPASNDKMPKDLASDGEIPRTGKVPSETETNLKSGNQTLKNEKMQKDLTIENKTPNNDKMAKSLTIDGKALQSKVKTKKNLTSDNKSPNNEKKQTNLKSDDKTPRSSDKMQRKSKKDLTSVNQTLNNDKIQKDLTSDGKMPRSDKTSESEMGMSTNLTSGNKMPNYDKMPKDLTIDGKALQSKVKSETDLMNGDKSPYNEENQLNFSSVGKAPSSVKMPSKSKTESGNKTPNKEKMQKDLARDGKMPRSGKVPSKDITQSEKKTETNLPSGNNLPNNDKMQSDGTELLDEFKALLKSDEYKTEGTIILIDWLLEKECKFSKNMNKNSGKLEVNDGKNKVGLEKSYEIYSKICAENGEKKAILAEYREQLTQMKDTLITHILAKMKEFEEILQKNGPNCKQYVALLKFGDDVKAFLDEMPEMEGKSAIIALLASNLSSPILPSDLIQLVLIANKVNSKNLNTTNVRRRRHARNAQC
ncbi:hypothetical protein niasHS_001225 [Heterodera schachtii]|uniref:Uncharacterized protein n=1 Tax=Heterodera schachtii TaxID=97005 RepID=A0ABD2KHS8_HETSC